MLLGEILGAEGARAVVPGCRLQLGFIRDTRLKPRTSKIYQETRISFQTWNQHSRSLLLVLIIVLVLADLLEGHARRAREKCRASEGECDRKAR